MTGFVALPTGTLHEEEDDLIVPDASFAVTVMLAVFVPIDEYTTLSV